MADFDDDLRGRLITLEQAVIVPSQSPRKQRRHLRRAWVIGFASVFFVGSAASATAVVRHAQEAHSAAGLFSPGGLLACSNLWEMTPEQAQRYLNDRGYQVHWQVEDDQASRSRVTDTAPRSGYIIEGVADGNELTLVVIQGPGAAPANVPHC